MAVFWLLTPVQKYPTSLTSTPTPHPTYSALSKQTIKVQLDSPGNYPRRIHFIKTTSTCSKIPNHKIYLISHNHSRDDTNLPVQTVLSVHHHPPACSLSHISESHQVQEELGSTLVELVISEKCCKSTWDIYYPTASRRSGRS